jgi:tRNA pseudouridine55 synthase
MAALRRVTAGEYTAEMAVPLQTLIESADPGAYLLPVDSMFANHPPITLTEKQEKCCRNGVAFTCNLAEGTYRVYGQNGEFLALSHMVEGKLTTIKSFWAV